MSSPDQFDDGYRDVMRQLIKAEADGAKRGNTSKRSA